MKKTKRLLFLCLTVAILVVSMTVLASAADGKYYLLKDEYGELENGQAVSYDFTMPANGKSTIFFFGYYGDYEKNSNSEYEYTYGNCDLTIVNDEEETVYSTKRRISYDDVKIEVELDKGNYTLTIETGDEDYFVYRMSMYLSSKFKATKVTLDKKSVSLEKGKSTKLKATVSPKYCTETLTWTSSNSAVATVDKNGKVTAKALGKATVTAKCGSLSAKCTVAVNKTTAEVSEGEKIKLASYVKKISGYKEGKWTSSDKKKATVSSSGVVTAADIGTCNIVFKAPDGTKYTVALKIFSQPLIVYLKENSKIKTGGSKKHSFSIPANGRAIINVYGVYREQYSEDGYWYSSANMSLKVLDSDGDEVAAKKMYFPTDVVENSWTVDLKKGKYTLVIKDIEKEKGYSFVNSVLIGYSSCVKVKTNKISFKKKTIKLAKEEGTYLTPVVTPYYSNDTQKWTSSNKKVATVSDYGYVIAKELGKTTVTVKSGSKTAKCTVIVNKADASVLKNKTVKLASYVKQIPNYKKGKWSSSDNSVATVNSSGTVTGKKSGSCSVVFKATDGTKYTFALKVKAWVTAKVTEVKDDRCWIRIDNNTGKDITYITLDIKQYDNRGYKLQSPYDYYYINDTLPSKWYGTYSFWINDDSRSAKVKIRKIWFSDGTTYTP